MRTTRTLAGIGLGALTALLGGGLAATDASAATPATATQGGLVAHASKLVLQENAGHYLGTLTVTARNTGSAPVNGGNLLVDVPAGLRNTSVTGDVGGCFGGGAQPGVESCTFFGSLAPGASTTFSLDFTSYAAAARHARITAGGWVALTQATTPAPREKASFAGVLAGNGGSTADPRPYHPSSAYDATLATGGPVTVTPQPDGSRVVRVPLAAGYRTDAPNDQLDLTLTLPDGVTNGGVEPAQVCGANCPVPGDWFVKGETRAFAQLLDLAPETPVGTFTVGIKVGTSNGSGTEPVDAHPADNTVSVTFTA